MKTKISAVMMIIGMIVISVSGCKKSDVQKESPLEINYAEKVKAWYEAKIKTLDNILMDEGQKTMRPDWNKTRYQQAKNVYITPVNVGAGKSGIIAYSKYLLIEMDAAGNISQGFYFYLFTRDNRIDDMMAVRLMTGEIPVSFNGALLKYDLSNNFMLNRHFENGKQSDKTDKLISKKTIAANSGGISNGPVSNSAPVPTCEGTIVEIQWYWQTWQNGVLIYEEYLYSTFYCSGGGGGGTGGGSVPPPPTPLEQCQVAVQNILNGCTASSQLVSNIINQDGPLMRERLYAWKCVTGFGWYVIAYDKGVQIRAKTTTPWSWSSLENINISKVGNTAAYGGTVEVKKVLSYPVLGAYNATMYLVINVKASISKLGASWTNEKDISTHFTYFVDATAVPGF